jgi:hypothetical protein
VFSTAQGEALERCVIFKKMFVFLTLLLMPFSLALGQAVSTNGGAIEGTITDPTGASIPGATVVIAEPATGYTHTIKTDSAGYYSVGPLVPGSYTITISAPAFEGLSDTKVVHTGTVTSGNEKLTLGAATQQITVTAGALQVNTDQIGVAGIVTQEQIDTLPVNGRNILDVAQIQPGVILQSGITFDPTKAGYSALSVSGVGGRTTRILLDGQDVTDETVGTTIFNIPSGAVGEVQLNRSTQDIAGSVTSTGQLLMSTRSGTNGFHGNAFYNFQDNNAGFADVNGLAAPFQRNQYGGYVGGYIIKDKLFFFGGGERIQQTELDVASGANPVFQNILDEYPYVPAPFHDTFSMGRLDYNAPHNIHMFVRGAYSVNADDATFGYGPYQVYQNRDNVPAIVGGVDVATGHFNNSFRFGYEKFHNLLVDGTAALGSSIYNPSTGPDNQITLAGDLNAGPNFLAPQGTFQSDKQFRYDGSYTISNHNIKYGFEMNRILGGGFADFYGPSLYTELVVAGNLDPHCDDDPTQGPCPNNPTEGYISPQYVIGNGNGYFSERPGFNLPGGGQFSWRFAAYVGDTWKATQYLTVTAGVRWSVDTDRANQDLPTPLCSSVDPSMQFAGCTGDTPLFDQYQAGLGVRTHQPYGDFGPQLGFVFSPGTHKTSLRGGIGIYYESNVFNNSGNARTPSIQANGPYFALGVANAGASSITVPGVPVITQAPDGTPVSTILSESIANAAPELNDIKAAYQAVVKNALTPNSSYIGTGGGLFANSIYGGPYLAPYSIQFNGGVQHEIKPGLLLSADYVHNATIKVPISVDVNHDGAARTLNTAAAQNAIANTLAPNAAAGYAGYPMCPQGYSAASINCAIANGATIGSFASQGLDSGTNFLGGTAASYGGLTPATGAAFPGTNPNVGEGLFILPQGRSGYDALQVVLQEQKAHPMPGIVDSNLQISYTLSRIVTSTSTLNNANSTDQFFGGARPWDNDNPNQYMGRSALDHTNELSFGGSIGIKYGLQVGLIGHFFSAPPSSLTLDNTSGNTGQIFITDVNGDGVGGDLVPATNPGAFMHAVKGKSLNSLINQYNSVNAGAPTPAGQALIAAGIMTQAQLTALGGVQQAIAPQPQNNPISNPAFRSFDFNATYPIKLKFLGNLSINPGVAMYNVFNMSNFGNQLGTLLNAADAAPYPPDPGAPTGYVNTTNTEGALNRLRINRNSGTFDQGGPRSTEFQLMIKF